MQRRTRSTRRPAAGGSPSAASAAFDGGSGGSGGLVPSSGALASAPGRVAAAGGAAPMGRTTLADVIDWTINLPWQKAFSWFVVAVVASQLRDFFGVSAAELELPLLRESCCCCCLPAC